MKTVHKKYLITAFLVWGGCAVVLGAVYFVLMSPRAAEYNAIKQKLAAKETEYKQAMDANIPGRAEQIAQQLEAQEQILGDFVADREQTANLTFAISQLAQARDIVSPSVKDRDKSTGSTLEDCPHLWKKQFDVQFKSGFPGFFSMLHAVESHRPVMFVETFSIIPDNQEENANDVKFDISVLARQTKDG
jgi:hypothetical protein